MKQGMTNKVDLIEESARETTYFEQIEEQFEAELNNSRNLINRLESKVDKILGFDSSKSVDSSTGESMELSSSVIGLLKDNLTFYKALNKRFEREIQRLDQLI